MLGRLVAVSVLGGALYLFPGTAAAAHGPCECTTPAVTEAGAKVRTGEAYKVVWNPAPSDFTGSAPRGLESGYQPDAPTVVVVDRPRSDPAKRPSFRVPSATPPGIYLVLIYDGSEGGTHATWDYVQIRGPEPTATASADSSSGDDGGGEGALAAAFGVGVCASLLSLVLLRRRRANSG